MKILTVSDRVERSFFKENLLREECQGINLILACGDLPPYYLEYLVNSLNVSSFIMCREIMTINIVSPPRQKDLSVKGCENIDQKGNCLLKDCLLED